MSDAAYRPLDVWDMSVYALAEEGVTFLGQPVAAFCVAQEHSRLHEFFERARPVIDWLARHATNRPTQVCYHEYGNHETDREWGSEAIVVFYDETDAEEFAIWCRLNRK